MQFPLSTLIALRQLTAKPLRLIAGMLGVIAAFLMMSAQLGFRDALYESAVRLHRGLDADIVLTSPSFVSLVNMPRFSDAYLYRAGGLAGVVSAIPFYADAVPWRNPRTGIPRLINVYGFELGTRPFLMREVGAQAAELADPEAVLFDRLSRPEFGPVATTVAAGEAPVIGLSLDQRFPGDRTVRVAGVFSLGPSFVIDGDIITSDRGFRRITGVSLDRITFGLVKLERGVRADAFAPLLQRELGPGVAVVSKRAFIAEEKRYWAEQTSIGFIFGLGLIIGFVVGAVFVHQVMFTIILENMREYAVLRSLGYPLVFLHAIILQAAGMVGLLAIVGGVPLAIVVAGIARRATGLPITLDAPSVLQLLAATLGMTLLGGAVAARRLRRADIIELFA